MNDDQIIEARFLINEIRSHIKNPQAKAALDRLDSIIRKSEERCDLCKREEAHDQQADSNDPSDISFRVCRSHSAVGMWKD